MHSGYIQIPDYMIAFDVINDALSFLFGACLMAETKIRTCYRGLSAACGAGFYGKHDLY